MSALPKPGPAPYSPEWHALRLFDPDRAEHPVVFGASDAAMAMENPLELFLLKTGRKPAPEVSEDMEVGSLMEPVVLEMYRRRSGTALGHLVVNQPLYFHGEHSFMAATPDAIGVIDPAHVIKDLLSHLRSYGTGAGPHNIWGADAKTAGDRMFLKDATAEDTRKYGEEGTDLVPDYTLWQMTQQCAVMNFPFVDVPVLFGRKYRCYRVHRDETLIAALVSAEKELAERILEDRPPEANWRHPNTRECLRLLHGLDRGVTIVLSDEGFDRWTNVCRRKQEIKGLDDQNEEDTNRILAEMADAEKAVMPSGTKAIKRIVVRDSLWTDKDIEDARAKLGTVKRAGHERMQEVKA